MLYLNYELAQSLIDESDPIVRVVAAQLHQEMISHDVRAAKELRPQWPFDMAYFYVSVSATVAKFLDCRFERVLAAPNIMAAGVPDLACKPFVEHDFTSLGLAASYIEMVEAESISGGSPFDVQFVLQIAGRALKRDFFQTMDARIERASKQRADAPWDEWIKRFETDV